MSDKSFSSDPVVEKSLRHSLKDAAAFATMTGMGETYLSAFALFLKATTPQIGLLASVPPLLASFVQLVSAWLGRLTGRRHAIVIVGASIQALAWLPIVLLPLLVPQYAVPLLIVSVVLYQCGANLAAPQWASMMGDIVPTRRRGRFFARRTGIVSQVTFVSIAIGGATLHVLSDSGHTLLGFVVLFAVAMLARCASVYQLSQIFDPPGHVAQIEVPVGHRWWQRLRRSQFVRFSMFNSLMQFSVAIASPFFTVYMLRDLDYTYLQFMFNTGAAIFAQFLTLSQWGRISDVFGNRRIMSVTGIFIPIVPLLWVFSDNYWYLLMAQAVSGFCWAGFTLSAGNFLYDLIARERRATYLAVHNVLASVGVFCGATLGGYLATVFPTELTLFGKTFRWLSPLICVFVTSALMRALVVTLLVPKIREVRRVRPTTTSQVIFRVTRVNALAGLIFDIVGAKPDADDRSAPR